MHKKCDELPKVNGLSRNGKTLFSQKTTQLNIFQIRDSRSRNVRFSEKYTALNCKIALAITVRKSFFL